MSGIAHILPFVVRESARLSIAELTARLEARFRDLRAARVRRLFAGDAEVDHGLPRALASYLDDETGDVSLPACSPGPVERDRLIRRARKLHEARQRASDETGVSALKPGERALLEAASRGVEARGRVTEHKSDEIAAALHAEIPWMAGANTRLMRSQRARARAGLPFRLAPIILVGPPGTGKSTWARRVADLYGVPRVDIDVGGSGGAVMSLAGLEKGWGSARPGSLVQAMLTKRVSNPLVVIDELHLASQSVSTTAERSSSLPGLFAVLLGMLEPVTARAWVCPYYGVPIDLTGVSWVMTANSLDGIPAPLLNRCTVIRVDALSADELVGAARSICAGRDPEISGMVTAAVEGAAREGRRMTLRDVARAVVMAEEVCGAESAN